MKINAAAFVTALFLLALSAPVPVRADRIWWDGSRDTQNAPPGKLLSDNAGWWGECVLTGVEYRYETAPDAPADIWKEEKGRFGRRLLDGIPVGNWWVPVGLVNRPLAVVFDFKRVCRFAEVDLVTQSNKVALILEVGDEAAGPWRRVFERAAEACPDKSFHRIPLAAQPAQGRYLRLSVQKPGDTYLNEVLVWGDTLAPADEKTPEAIQPLNPTPNITGVSFASLPGIPKTVFADAQFWAWQRGLGPILAKQPAVWSRVPTWAPISDRPLLPTAKERASSLTLTVARNETECAALALTNTVMEKPVTSEVTLGPFRRVGRNAAVSAAVRGEVRVAGTIGSRHFGVNVGPLIARDNKPGKSLLRRYLTNGALIEDFPRLILAPAGSAVLWLSVTTDNAAPGIYEARLRFGQSNLLPIRVEVLPVTLPKPFVWLNTWSDTTTMFPFVYADRTEREVAYKQGLGVTVWSGLPAPGTAAQAARRRGRTHHQVLALPADYVNKAYNNQIKAGDLTAKDAAAVAAHVRALIAQTRMLGLNYDDWSAELWDEPGLGNAALFGALARIVKKADPKVRVYCNPLFWEGSGVLPDATVYAALAPWYRDVVDVSVPVFLINRSDRVQSYSLFNTPGRFVNASYSVSTQSAKSEQAERTVLYRKMAWDAFVRGANGWGFYSYSGLQSS